MLALCLILLCSMESGGLCLKPLSPLLMTHSLKAHIIIAVENDTGVLANAFNLFKQNLKVSTLLLWNRNELHLIKGNPQEIDRDTMVHVVGHGTSVGTLSGYTPMGLANIIGHLSFRELQIGHVSLIACKIHRPPDSKDDNGYLYSLLEHLVFQHQILTSVSAWTTEVAVDTEGRLLSKVHGSTWYINYPDSLVVAYPAVD